MSRNRAQTSPKTGTLGHLQKRFNSISRQVDEFYDHLNGFSSITSPERKQNYKKCSKLKSEIELLSSELSSLSKDDDFSSIQAFNEQKRKERQKLVKLKSKLDRISEQLEPDEIEEDYFRKMQDGGVGASNSDLVSENADEGVENKGESEDEDDNEDDYDEGDSEEEDTASKTIVVHKVEALSNFRGDQDGDLSFKKGDILTVLETREDGWWLAENASGEQGVVPKTLLRILDDVEESPSENNNEDDDKSAIRREAADQVPELLRQRSGRDLWKTLEKGTHEQTSATDVLKAMGAMPTGFRSTTLGKIIKEETWQMSAWLFPKLSASNLAFRDITWDPVHKQLRPRPAKTVRLFQVLSARMIPLPGTGIEVQSRHVRMAIWDLNKKQALSNILSVRATATDKDPLTWTFTPKAASSVFDSEVLARINSNDDSIAILFELNMLYTRLSTGERSEVTCGWCVMRLFEENGSPVPNKTNEIQLNGGTLFDVGVDLDPSISLKASSNRFQQVIRSNRQPRLSVKLISLQRREMYDMLPDTLLTYHVYVPFISLYRQLLAEALMHEGRNQQNADLIMDPVIATFPKILYTTDVMDALKRCWDEKSKREVKRSQRRDGAYMRRFFREVYMDSVFPITHSAEIPPYIWGSDERESERLKWILNHFEKRTALENLLSADLVYKPFTVDRLYIDVCSKHSTT